jgi:hypothetical protein
VDTLTFTFVLILLAVGILLVVQVSPYYSRRDYSRESTDEEGGPKDAHHEKLKEQHRMRRQRDRVWFRMDKLHDEFVKRSSVEKPTLKQLGAESSSRASDGEADSWNDVTLAYIKEKYESFLKSD